MLNLSADAPAKRWLVPVFFTAVLILGIFIFRDYGLSFDEAQCRDSGMVTLKHVAQKVAPAWVAADPSFDKYQTPLAEYVDRDYGMVFETPVCLLERLLHIDDDGNKFLLRHLCTFLVCLGGLIALYQLAARRFHDWRLGLLAALFFLLSPRFFAESFYNNKDLVFMSLFAIAMNTGVRFLLRPTLGRAAWHALACALTIDVRIMGVLLPAVTVGVLVWRGLRAEVPWLRVAGVGSFYLVLAAGLVVAFWPYLWPWPVHNFVEAFDKMSSFRWPGTVLYRGEMVPAANLPWHYALVWLGITTPVLYLATGALGIALVLWHMVRHHWRLWHSEEDMQDVMFMSFFLGPLLAVVVLHSVLYDGWRQLYFIYPGFLLVALRGWVAAARWRPRWAWWPRAVYGVTALSLLLTAAQMVRDHPLQNVYFNVLGGTNVGQRFEMDYWGLGYRKSLEYLIKHEPRPVVNVHAPGPGMAGFMSPAQFNLLMLPADQRDRLHFVEAPEGADYFLTNYRWHPEPYPYEHEVFQLHADGRRIHSIFKLKW